VDDVVEGRVDVAVREHDAEESFGVGVAGEAADGRYLAQEIGGEGSGDLLRLLKEDLALAAGQAADFIEGHLEGDTGLARIGGRLDTGNAHPGGSADRGRGPFGLALRTNQEIVCHASSLALDNSDV
jgi:hypothetical protein